MLDDSMMAQTQIQESLGSSLGSQLPTALGQRPYRASPRTSCPTLRTTAWAGEGSEIAPLQAPRPQAFPTELRCSHL